MVLEFSFGLEKFRAFTVEEEEEKKIRRRRKKEEGRREVQEFKVWILVKELYGICAWKYLIETVFRMCKELCLG